ncbi:hypothetical protein N7499_009046 [Penicillium canescens]|uniref:SIR2-like domain-containing protein n=1 Tax=Penicillium canescens TaxID=5083 RepID=A0AAD6NF12_PENCN|nr:hypothetical protein N7460_001306 [Penicillium canescens]KAJ6071032.1 hypothetical protein N7499_009046 [Penicillium canescens]
MDEDRRLLPQSSSRQKDWINATLQGDDNLLAELVESEHPGQALYELETFINGLYRSSQILSWIDPLDPLIGTQFKAKVERITPYVERIRSELGWHIREFDLQLLRQIRKSGCLSPVLGAGASIAWPCCAPSWLDIVQELLETTLEKGLVLNQNVRPIEFEEGVAVSSDDQGEVRRYDDEQASTARRVLSSIKEVKAGKKTPNEEELKQGAEVCYDLCGQRLFTLLTGILYHNNRQPSGVHEAIAQLAHPQRVPDREMRLCPGWDSIITYNFDSFMEMALSTQNIPHAAWAMNGDKLAGDPDILARQNGQAAVHQSVYHLHGYTPAKLFKITHTQFVFATSQYKDYYDQPRSEIFRKVMDDYIANPVHIALYVGCSFIDEEMNRILRNAIETWPGRYHYALLPWPHERKDDEEPSLNEIEACSKKYLEFGVRPIWFDKFDEIPELIAKLA